MTDEQWLEASIWDSKTGLSRQMMSGVISAFEAADNVPEADKQAVRPYMDKLGDPDEDDWEEDDY